jgi:hypothetical protein
MKKPRKKSFVGVLEHDVSSAGLHNYSVGSKWLFTVIAGRRGRYANGFNDLYLCDAHGDWVDFESNRINKFLKFTPNIPVNEEGEGDVLLKTIRTNDFEYRTDKGDWVLSVAKTTMGWSKNKNLIYLPDCNGSWKTETGRPVHGFLRFIPR